MLVKRYKRAVVARSTPQKLNNSGSPAKAEKPDLDEHEKALLNEVLDKSPGVSWDAIAGLEEVKRDLAQQMADAQMQLDV